MSNETTVNDLIEILIELPPFERKQIALVMIASTLGEISRNEALTIASLINLED